MAKVKLDFGKTYYGNFSRMSFVKGRGGYSLCGKGNYAILYTATYDVEELKKRFKEEMEKAMKEVNENMKFNFKYGKDGNVEVEVDTEDPKTPDAPEVPEAQDGK